MNETLLGIMLHLAPIIALVFLVFTLCTAILSHLCALTSVKWYSFFGMLIGLVPLTEALLLRCVPKWQPGMMFIALLWSAMPYALVVNFCIFIWMIGSVSRAQCKQRAKVFLLTSAGIALFMAAAFTWSLSELAAI